MRYELIVHLPGHPAISTEYADDLAIARSRVNTIGRQYYFEYRWSKAPELAAPDGWAWYGSDGKGEELIIELAPVQYLEQMYNDRIEYQAAQAWEYARQTQRDLAEGWTPRKLEVHFQACRRVHATSEWVGADEFDRLYVRKHRAPGEGALKG